MWRIPFNLFVGVSVMQLLCPLCKKMLDVDDYADRFLYIKCGKCNTIYRIVLERVGDW